MAAMNFSDLLSRRFSCRAFKPDPVPRDTIEAILAMAQKTASWNNVQPWHVHVIGGQRLEAFREAMLDAYEHAQPAPDFPWPKEYHGVYQQRRRECGFGLYAAVGIAKGDRVASARQARENFRFFGAPHVAIVTSDAALDVYGAVDAGAYVSNFMLAATSLGVATIAQGALASRSPVIREFLQLPDDRKILCGISFGYCDEAQPVNAFRTTRAGIADTTTWVE